MWVSFFKKSFIRTKLFSSVIPKQKTSKVINVIWNPNLSKFGENPQINMKYILHIKKLSNIIKPLNLKIQTSCDKK